MYSWLICIFILLGYFCCLDYIRMCSPFVNLCYYDLGCIIIVYVILLNVHVNTHYYCQCHVVHIIIVKVMSCHQFIFVFVIIMVASSYINVYVIVHICVIITLAFFINVCVIILVYYRHVNALRCFYFYCLSFANSFAYWNLQKVES